MFKRFFSGKDKAQENTKKEVVAPIARRGDAIMFVSQNNSKRSLTVADFYDESGLLESALGKSLSELVGQDFKKILPERIIESINEYLDYDDLGNDLVSVLQRVKNFCITVDGKDHPFNIRIQRDVVVDEDMRYAIVVNNPNEEKRLHPQKLIEALKNSERDTSTGTYNVEGFRQIMSTVQGLIREDDTTGMFIMIKLKQYHLIVRQRGLEAAMSIVNELISSCALTFRQEDIIGYLEDGRIGILLVSADMDQVLVPLNRLRWNIKRLPFFSLPSDKLPQAIQAGCINLQGFLTLDAAIEHCDEAISEGDAGEMFHIVELDLGEHP